MNKVLNIDSVRNGDWVKPSQLVPEKNFEIQKATKIYNEISRAQQRVDVAMKKLRLVKDAEKSRREENETTATSNSEQIEDIKSHIKSSQEQIKKFKDSIKAYKQKIRELQKRTKKAKSLQLVLAEEEVLSAKVALDMALR